MSKRFLKKCKALEFKIICCLAIWLSACLAIASSHSVWASTPTGQCCNTVAECPSVVDYICSSVNASGRCLDMGKNECFYTGVPDEPLKGIKNPVIPGLTANFAKQFGQIISGILGVLLAGAGIMAFLYFLLGGIQWITSGGDKAGVEAARQKILNALIGLIIVFGTWAVMKFVFAFLGIDFPYFTLPTLVGK